MKENLTKQEKMNYDSFSTDNQLSVYGKDSLLDIEKEVVAAWFPLEKQGYKILDIACGSGRTTINFHRMGFDVVGIDVVPNQIEHGRKLYPELDLRVMNACELEFEDESFDMVFFSFNGLDCIYPIEKRWQAVEESKRVLKRGGFSS